MNFWEKHSGTLGSGGIKYICIWKSRTMDYRNLESGNSECFLRGFQCLRRLDNGVKAVELN